MYSLDLLKCYILGFSKEVSIYFINEAIINILVEEILGPPHRSQHHHCMAAALDILFWHTLNVDTELPIATTTLNTS